MDLSPPDAYSIEHSMRIEQAMRQLGLAFQALHNKRGGRGGIGGSGGRREGGQWGVGDDTDLCGVGDHDIVHPPVGYKLLSQNLSVSNYLSPMSQTVSLRPQTVSLQPVSPQQSAD